MRRVICFVNRTIGARVARDLISLDGVELALIVVHDSPHADIDTKSFPRTAPVVPWSSFLNEVASATEPYDAGVSALFGRLIPDSVLSLVTDGIVNLHPSLLPFGRGKHPATWSIWEQTPYGASAHLVTSDVDAGPLLGQTRIPILDTDTSQSLYEKGLNGLWDLYLRKVRPWIQGLPVTWELQASGGSLHREADLTALQAFARDSKMSMTDHVRVLRALSMGSGRGLILPSGAEDIVVEVSLSSRIMQPKAEEA